MLLHDWLHTSSKWTPWWITNFLICIVSGDRLENCTVQEGKELIVCHDVQVLRGSAFTRNLHWHFNFQIYMSHHQHHKHFLVFETLDDSSLAVGSSLLSAISAAMMTITLLAGVTQGQSLGDAIPWGWRSYK